MEWPRRNNADKSKQITTIGIDMGGTNLRVGLIRDGKVVKVLKERCKATGTEEEVLEQFYRMIGEIMIPEVESIGVAVPSVVDYDNGIVYDVMNIPSWKEVHLKELLEKKFGVPTKVDNDVNCFVNAEFKYGAGKGYRHLVGITLGTGVGAGIITNGKVYRGSNTGAGEIGCLPYLDGIYEEYTSAQLFKKWDTTGEEEATMADNGDYLAVEHWKELGHHLGKLLQVILYTYDPECIIIGGGISQSAFRFKDSMIESLKENFLYPHEIDRVKIVFSSLEDSNLLGCC